MKREIKFRAWDTDGSMIYSESNSEWHITAFGVQCRYGGDRIMQFTGLKDKNGIDIYEGDILAFENTINFKTVFQNNFEIKWEDYGNGMIGFTQFHPRNKFVVIGNIYENPELLNK